MPDFKVLACYKFTVATNEMAGMKNFTDMMRKIKYCGPLN
jgi:hypothetical protein